MFKLSPGAKQELERLGVGILYLFGSVVEKTAGKGSDYDLAVVLFNPQKDYYNLYPILYRLLGNEIPRGYEVDISFLDFSPLSFQFEVINKGKILYQISPEFRVNFEEKISRNYFDLRFLLAEQEKVTLEVFK